MRVLKLLTALLLASGCASGSANGVPELDVEKIHAPQLEGIAGRSISLTVRDQREPKPESSPETVQELERALQGVFRRSGAAASADASNTLSVSIRYMDEPLADLEREDCLLIELKLTLPDQERQSFGGCCFSYKHWLGFRMADDPDQVYTTALDTALKLLERDPVGP